MKKNWSSYKNLESNFKRNLRVCKRIKCNLICDPFSTKNSIIISKCKKPIINIEMNEKIPNSIKLLHESKKTFITSPKPSDSLYCLNHCIKKKGIRNETLRKNNTPKVSSLTSRKKSEEKYLIENHKKQRNDLFYKIRKRKMFLNSFKDTKIKSLAKIGDLLRKDIIEKGNANSDKMRFIANIERDMKHKRFKTPVNHKFNFTDDFRNDIKNEKLKMELKDYLYLNKKPIIKTRKNIKDCYIPNNLLKHPFYVIYPRLY